MSVKFLMEVLKLKLIPRSGWIAHGIGLADVESVAEHSFSTSVIAYMVARQLAGKGKAPDLGKTLAMSLLHDIPEALTFDISKQYLKYLGTEGERIKDSLERHAVSDILKGVEDQRLASDIKELLEEYMDGKTLEARIVRYANALDILTQILQYERRGYSKGLVQPLWDEVIKRLEECDLEPVRLMLSRIVEARQAL